MEIEIGGTYVFKFARNYPPELVFVVERMPIVVIGNREAPYDYKVMNVRSGDYPVYAYKQELKPMWYETEMWHV